MTEHLEFQSASIMLNDLVQRRAVLMQKLRTPEHKGDIMMTGMLNRIQNDIQELDKVMTNSAFMVLTGFEAKYGCQFKFLTVRKQPKP